MFKTPYYPTVVFEPIFNSQKLRAKRHTTWVKQKDFKVNGRVQDILVQCYTFEFEQNIDLGNFDSKVTIKKLCDIGKNELWSEYQINFIMLKQEPTHYSLSPAPSIKEFWVYIHNLHGYVNTFMLGDGRPSVIIPGYDKGSGLNITLDTHHYIIKYFCQLSIFINRGMSIVGYQFKLQIVHKKGHCCMQSKSNWNS